jgi:hypothetical protein
VSRLSALGKASGISFFCIPITVYKSQMTVHISQITIHIPQYIYSIYHRSQYIHQPHSFTNHQVFHKCCLHNTIYHRSLTQPQVHDKSIIHSINHKCMTSISLTQG